MSFNRWGYEFDGPYLNPDQLQAKGGVYVVRAATAITGKSWMSGKLKV